MVNAVSFDLPSRFNVVLNDSLLILPDDVIDGIRKTGGEGRAAEHHLRIIRGKGVATG